MPMSKAILAFRCSIPSRCCIWFRAPWSRTKTPVLGLQTAWPAWSAGVDFMNGYQKILDAWTAASKGVVLDPPVTETEVPIRREANKDETIDAGHGSFDNNLNMVNRAIKRIIGKNPPEPVTDLRGF